jgi:transposase
MNLTVNTKYVCGIDLHAKNMSVCVMDKDGKVLLKRNISCEFDVFLALIKPYKRSVTVGVESTYNWYWLLDKLKEHDISCALGHALYISRMKSSKHKNDPVDAQDIADLLRTNKFPLAYDYPQEMRDVRDLLRRRHHFVWKRAGTFTHFQNTFNQHGIIDPLYAAVQKKLTRRNLLEKAANQDMKQIVASDLDYVDSLDTIISGLEKVIIKRARYHNRKHFDLLHTIVGCGDISSLIILYETHTIDRFATPQRYSSYSRVISSDNESSGKYLGHSSSDKIGNPYLKWAFSEIAVHMIKDSPLVKEWYTKESAIHGAGGAKARLRHKITVAVYHMLKRNEPFDEYKFLNITKDRIDNPAHNWMETSGKKSKPIGVIGKQSGLSPKKTGRPKKKTPAETCSAYI